MRDDDAERDDTRDHSYLICGIACILAAIVGLAVVFGDFFSKGTP